MFGLQLIKLTSSVYPYQPVRLPGKPSLCNKTEMKMQTTLNQTINTTYSPASSHTSLWKRFITWCEKQEYNRLLWVGVILAAHGCALTPFTVMATLLTGPNFFLFMCGMVAMGIALVTNLAAMPKNVRSRTPKTFRRLLPGFASASS